MINFDVPLSVETLERVRRVMKASKNGCVAYFDIDGTLVTDDNTPNEQVLTLLKLLHSEGARIYLWSAGGDENCRKVAARYGIEPYITACLPKPTISVDDMRFDDYVFLKLHPVDLVPAR